MSPHSDKLDRVTREYASERLGIPGNVARGIDPVLFVMICAAIQDGDDRLEQGQKAPPSRTRVPHLQARILDVIEASEPPSVATVLAEVVGLASDLQERIQPRKQGAYDHER